MNESAKPTLETNDSKGSKNDFSAQPLKLVLVGALGKMGQTLFSLCDGKSVTAICGIDCRARESTSSSDAPTKIYGCFSAAEENDDDFFKDAVIVDFSSSRAIFDILNFSKKRRLPLVLAATGYSKKEQEEIDRAAKYVPILQSANFSIGAALLERLGFCAKKALPNTFDTEIVETHHRYKKDAPSGTAAEISKALKKASARNDATFSLDYEESESIALACSYGGEIPIHSLRGGSIPGVHEILFLGDGEALSLKHTATDAKIFARGAIDAAFFLRGKEKGKYRVQDAFFSENSFRD